MGIYFLVFHFSNLFSPSYTQHTFSRNSELVFKTNDAKSNIWLMNEPLVNHIIYT